MNKITVEAAQPYDVLIGDGLLEQCGRLIRQACSAAQKVLIVSDTNVAPLYMDTVKSSLEGEGFIVSEYIFLAGEEEKNISSVAGMWSEMAREGFTRTDIVAALGGGVTGDMGGFAAATFLRGIRVVQISTSLLSMVDASVGGKTGIDLPQGKNLVGAFCQPALVIEDTGCLRSLSTEHFTEGMAEVIKYAFIMDGTLFRILSSRAESGSAGSLQTDAEALTDIVCRCVRDKAMIIAQDEHDNGIRQILNYGHTIGHVIERDSNYSLSHGVCVAKGMGIIIRACRRSGSLESKSADMMTELIRAYNLPTEDKITPEQAAEGARNDKKKRGDTISVILVNKIGSAEICRMSTEELLEFLKT